MKKILLTGLVLCLSISTTFSQLSRTGLQAAYKFDGNYKDSSNNKRHLLWSSTSLVADRNSTPNSAVQFNGDGGFMIGYIGSHTDLTIGYWFKPETQIDPYPHMWDYGNYLFRGMIMAGSIFNTSDRNKVYCGTNYPNEVFTKSSATVTYNQWQHIAFVFDKTNNKIKMYVNGTFSSENTITSSLSPQDSIIMFGRPKSGPDSEVETSGFKGVLDDIYIYNRALTAQEITDMKNGSFINLGVQQGGNTDLPEEISIYPNPTNEGHFTVKINNENIKVTSIKLFDLTGKLVLVAFDASDINTTSLSAGTYLVQINGQDNIVLGNEKIVVE